MTPGKIGPARLRPRHAAMLFALLALFWALPCFQPGALAQDAAPRAGTQRPKEPDVQPRRDYEMGVTSGNVLIDRDQQGDSVVEVKPKPQKPDQQQQMNMGPIIVVPKVNSK